MGSLMLAQIARIRTRELTETTLVRLLTFVQSTDVCLKLCVCSCRISTAVANVRSLASVSTLMVVFGLVGGKGFITSCIAACIWAVTCVA